MPATVEAPPILPFRVEFGRPATTPAQRVGGLELSIPLLAGDSHESLFSPVTPIQGRSGITLFETGDLTVGYVTEPVLDERMLPQQSQALYSRLLVAARGRHLYRIWNYVPRINAVTGSQENYRAFCQGRSLAFEMEVGAGFPHVLPSASGVGTHDGCLTLVFVAGKAMPRHFENPEQMPAYLYPPEHGPRSPSFSRATVAALPGRQLTFISGTAAIKGHLTVAPNELDAQLDCTLDNLRLISRATGLGDDLGATRKLERHFKVYLRHPEDLAATKGRLEKSLLRPNDRVIYLHSDICRAALNVEIEASIVS
ncbi:MAG: hypothetical protein JWM32_2006 [Verrucomicrobia bacterium]|nr:hypothetical protein [Verrucomicrobiota bacterium]